MRVNGLKKFYPIIFITAVVILIASLLALTDSFTWDKLKAQQDQKTLELLKGIFPEASFYSLKNDIYTIYDNSRDEIGYAFYAEGEGFSDNIVILVGLEDKETIKGIKIISHKERMGWGEGISVPLDFSSLVGQFVGLNVALCSLKKDGGQVDGISGATGSSKAVASIVKETVLQKVNSIR